MKKKQKKARKVKTQKELDKISCGSAQLFPTQLSTEEYFKSPIWFGDAPQFVDDLNKHLTLILRQQRKI